MAVKIDWEIVIHNLPSGGISLMRLCVPGGWLVKSHGENEVSMCFLPDPKHEWLKDLSI